jgi:hypothetical protein
MIHSLEDRPARHPLFRLPPLVCLDLDIDRLIMKSLRIWSVWLWVIAGGSVALGQGQSPPLSYQDASACYARLRPPYAYDDFVAYESAQDSVRLMVKALMEGDPQMARDLKQAGDWLKVVTSSDQRLRICSWDERSGGTMHDMCTLAQIRMPSGKLTYVRLDPSFGQSNGTDVMYTDLFTLKGPDGPRYLALGVGSYGSGHHHRSARLLAIEGDTLIDAPQAFGDQPFLELLMSNQHTTYLRFNLDTRTLSHPEYIEDEELGIMQPTGRVMHWQYEAGRFVPHL